MADNDPNSGSYPWIQQTPKARESVSKETAQQIANSAPQAVPCPMCHGTGQLTRGQVQQAQQQSKPKSKTAAQPPPRTTVPGYLDPVPAGRGFGQLYDQDGNPI